MGDPRTTHGQPRTSHGQPMGSPLATRGRSAAKPRASQGRLTDNPYSPTGSQEVTNGRPTGNSWATHRRLTDKPRTAHGRPTSDPWASHGRHTVDPRPSHSDPQATLEALCSPCKVFHSHDTSVSVFECRRQQLRVCTHLSCFHPGVSLLARTVQTPGIAHGLHKGRSRVVRESSVGYPRAVDGYSVPCPSDVCTRFMRRQKVVDGEPVGRPRVTRGLSLGG